MTDLKPCPACGEMSIVATFGGPCLACSTECQCEECTNERAAKKHWSISPEHRNAGRGMKPKEVADMLNHYLEDHVQRLVEQPPMSRARFRQEMAIAVLRSGLSPEEVLLHFEDLDLLAAHVFGDGVE